MLGFCMAGRGALVRCSVVEVQLFSAVATATVKNADFGLGRRGVFLFFGRSLCVWCGFLGLGTITQPVLRLVHAPVATKSCVQ